MGHGRQLMCPMPVAPAGNRHNARHEPWNGQTTSGFLHQAFGQKLIGWWLNQPIWKILFVKMGIFPKDRGENKQFLKPPPSDG